MRYLMCFVFGIALGSAATKVSAHADRVHRAIKPRAIDSIRDHSPARMLYHGELAMLQIEKRGFVCAGGVR